MTHEEAMKLARAVHGDLDPSVCGPDSSDTTHTCDSCDIIAAAIETAVADERAALARLLPGPVDVKGERDFERYLASRRSHDRETAFVARAALLSDAIADSSAFLLWRGHFNDDGSPEDAARLLASWASDPIDKPFYRKQASELLRAALRATEKP